MNKIGNLALNEFTGSTEEASLLVQWMTQCSSLVLLGPSGWQRLGRASTPSSSSHRWGLLCTLHWMSRFSAPPASRYNIERMIHFKIKDECIQWKYQMLEESYITSSIGCFNIVNSCLKLKFLFNSHAGWGKSRFTVVHMENNTIINNNTRINSVLRTHNYKPTFSLPCN